MSSSCRGKRRHLNSGTIVNVNVCIAVETLYLKQQSDFGLRSVWIVLEDPPEIRAAFRSCVRERDTRHVTASTIGGCLTTFIFIRDPSLWFPTSSVVRAGVHRVAPVAPVAETVDVLAAHLHHVHAAHGPDGHLRPRLPYSILFLREQHSVSATRTS